ncbi:DUF7620 family protein [Streptomyces olivaceus]
MRWTQLLHLRRRERTTAGQEAASSALRRSVRDKQEAEQRAPEVAAVARRLRDHRARNHFAETFRTAIEGGPR